MDTPFCRHALHHPSLALPSGNKMNMAKVGDEKLILKRMIFFFCFPFFMNIEIVEKFEVVQCTVT